MGMMGEVNIGCGLLVVVHSKKSNDLKVLSGAAATEGVDGGTGVGDGGTEAAVFASAPSTFVSHMVHVVLRLAKSSPDSSSKAFSSPYSITASFAFLVIDPAFLIRHGPNFSPRAHLGYCLTYFSTASLNL